MNIKKVKNRGFSLFVSIVASLILMSVSVAIIVSINRSLDQARNIARSNQVFFAIESGNEAALFHHNIRKAGLNWDFSKNIITLSSIGNGTTVNWGISGQATSGVIEKTLRENEKITIPLYWDNSINAEDKSVQKNMSAVNRKRLELSFPENSQINSSYNNQVAIIWSVSRKNNSGEYETWIPKSPDTSDPCITGSSYFCGMDLCQSSGGTCSGGTSHWGSEGIIDFDSTKTGLILPGNTEQTLQAFMGDTLSSDYEISFQPVLPFEETGGDKISYLNFKLGHTSITIPQNIYTITSEINFQDFKKKNTTEVTEKPSIGAFDYLIFK